MKRIRIIGVGSPSGDDQAGWLVADALRAMVPGRDDVAIDKFDRPGAQLITLFDGADWVILIDAMQAEGDAGSIRYFDLSDRADCSARLASSHGFGVLDAIALARELGCLPARIDLYGIEIGTAEPLQAAAPAIQTAAQHLARRIGAALSVTPPALAKDIG